MTRIQKLHASFVWSQKELSLPDNTASMAYLGNRKAFVDRFAALPRYLQRWPKEVWLTPEQQQMLAAIFDNTVSNKNILDTLHWALPWELREEQRSYRHYFWRYYLGGSNLADVSGEDAWDYLVPLRLRLPLRLAAPLEQSDRPVVRIFADGYVYPHGSALEIKLTFDYGRSPASEPLALSELLVIRNNGLYVSLPDAEPKHFSFQDLAERLLEFQRHLVWGKTIVPKAPSPSSNPLQIVTVIEGTSDSTSEPILSGSPLHQVLDGFCSFAPDWAYVKDKDLTPLDKSNLLLGSSKEGHISNKTDGHYLYHSPSNPQSRLVWMPLYFTSNSHHIHRLSCYHRNLMLLSLQTEMLAQALFLFESPPKRPAIPLPKQLAKAAAQRLADLYSGEGNKTYLSASPRAYLDESRYIKDVTYTEKINKILSNLKLSPLQWTAWGAAKEKP